jgi:hypothetical protein
MWPDALLILAFEIVGGSFLLGWLTGQIVRAETDKAAQQRADEDAFINLTIHPRRGK